MELQWNWWALSNLLTLSLRRESGFEWLRYQFSSTNSASVPQPALPKPDRRFNEPPPRRKDFEPRYSFFEQFANALFDPAKRANDTAAAEAAYQSALKAWQNLKASDEARTNDLSARIAVLKLKQKNVTATLAATQKDYDAGSSEGIERFCELVLSASYRPDYFPMRWSLEYQPKSKTLVLDYALPDPDDFPKEKLVEGKKRWTWNTRALSEKDKATLYDSTIYQLVLCCLHELFAADYNKTIVAIALNGMVTSIDRATGHKVEACVVSVLTTREEFLRLNLAAVDPKACFRALKGVGSSKLHGLAAVAPVLQLSRQDRRFIEARPVAQLVDNSVNLAGMDWEDFEHLIREVFEAEFKQGGGEVKVTQASRDGGVDAVAFDPDPVRGGKIVIQAKRYTNTVGVAAVRDLYGTVMNEGAMKGILVTTSDYGPDAYEFAKGKPLTLLNGSNLLHLLSRQGRPARIDIKEARRALGES